MMKIRSHVFSVLLVLIISLQLVGNASAFGYRNYDTSPVSAEEALVFSEKFKCEFLTEADKSYAINCYAVSDAGQIALGIDTSEDILIHVYNTEGQFLYGYQFPNCNSAFVLFFEEEYVSIYMAKTGYIASYDSDGNRIELRRVIDSERSNDAFLSDRYRATNGKIGDGWYYAERGILTTAFTRFMIEDNTGNRLVIYDVTKEHNTRMIGYGIVALVFFSLFAVISHGNKKEATTAQNNAKSDS